MSRTLIVQTAFLGDLLLGVPFFKELRRLTPDGHLTLLCRRGLGQILLQLKLVDEVVEVDKASKNSWRDISKKLRAQSFDLIICPHESFRSAWLTMQIRAIRKIGFRRFFNFAMFTDRLTRPMHLPEALRQITLLTPLDPGLREKIDQFAFSQGSPGGRDTQGRLLPVPEWASMRAVLGHDTKGDVKLSPAVSKFKQELFEAENRDGAAEIACLAPGSVWRTKMWTQSGFTELARELLGRKMKVVLIGAPNERDLCEQIARDAPGAVNAAGRFSLPESIELLAISNLLVCNDSGSMHMAAIAGTPTVSVFGPTVLEFGYRPWQNHARVVEIPQRDLRCRPCGSHGGETCPIGTHECMTRISAATVIATADSLRSV